MNLEIPTVKELWYDLRDLQAALKRWSTEHDVDVRLVVTSQGWEVMWGDPGYDPYHGDACAAGVLSLDMGDIEINELAIELVRDIEDIQEDMDNGHFV